MTQVTLNARNASYWNELCGSGLAREIGIQDASDDSLRRYDSAYFGLYPYLARYVTDEPLAGKQVLEIGLGYGTLGQFIAQQGADYLGLDIADGPVRMMRDRLSRLGLDAERGAVRGSALQLPFPDESFDYLYSIGCLHHTGDLPRAIREVRRVLRPGGRAIVMLYHAQSFRAYVLVPVQRARSRVGALLRGRPGTDLDARVRAMYDTNEAGDAPPHTDFVSRRDVRQLFDGFRSVRIDPQNFDTLSVARGRIAIPREVFLDNVAHVLGTDLYIVATR